MNCALPAWIAQEVYCRSFARKEFTVLIFWFFFIKKKEQIMPLAGNKKTWCMHTRLKYKHYEKTYTLLTLFSLILAFLPRNPLR